MLHVVPATFFYRNTPTFILECGVPPREDLQRISLDDDHTSPVHLSGEKASEDRGALMQYTKPKLRFFWANQEIGKLIPFSFDMTLVTVIVKKLM